MTNPKSAKFTNFNISSELARRLPYLATPVQKKTIPKILSGANTTSIARTGSGKTLAYLVPIIEKCLHDATPSVIVVPTRELVMQVSKMLKEILSGSKKHGDARKSSGSKKHGDARKSSACKEVDDCTKHNNKKDGNYTVHNSDDDEEHKADACSPDACSSDACDLEPRLIDCSKKPLSKFHSLRSIQIYGGSSIFKDFDKLSQPFNILIATVGRLRHCFDEINKKFEFNILCVDEMDRIFDDATMQSDLLYIIEKIKYKQKVFFSATLPEKLITLITDTDIIKIDNEISKTLTSIFFYTRNELKEKALIFTLDRYKDKRILIFAGTRHTVEYLSEIISVKHKKIYSSMDQQAREESLGVFLRQKVNVLIVTDLACRGLDIKDLDVVINYDLCDEKTFLHRIGRVARNGREGHSISLVSYNDIFLYYNIKETYFKDIEIGEIPVSLLDNIFVKESELKAVSERGNVKMENYRKVIKGIEVTMKVKDFEVHSLFKSEVNCNKEAFLTSIKNYKKLGANVQEVTKSVENKKVIDDKKDYKDQFYIPYTNKENKSSLHFSAFSMPKDEKIKEREVKRKKVGEMYKNWEKMKRKGGKNNTKKQ